MIIFGARSRGGGWGGGGRGRVNIFLNPKFYNTIIALLALKFNFFSKVEHHKMLNENLILYSNIIKSITCIISYHNFQKQPPRQFLKISVLFFQEQPFYNFPGGSICSSNRHEFSRKVHLFVEQT